MHANERNRGNKELYDENICINVNTMKLYKQGVEAATKKLNITEKQKKQIGENIKKRRKGKI